MAAEIIIPDKGFTHGSKFHSDDVFATAFLKILNPDIQIERGFEVPEDFDGIVYDIGRGKFDHHQTDITNTKQHTELYSVIITNT